MMHNLGYSALFKRVMNAVAAGTSDQTSSSIDTLGYEGVLFIASFGTLTATQVTTIKAQHSDDDSTFTDIASSASAALADADSNKSLILDINRPAKRYVRLYVDRGTANAVIDGVHAIAYNAHRSPVTQGTTVSSIEVLNAPASGTA